MHTPIEFYDNVWVKREDLCFLPPAPPFSKCRGIIKALEKLKERGYTTIGYTETAISMAGWGVAWACKKLGLKAVIFDPQYKNTPETLAYHRTKWLEFGAELVPIPAGRAKVGWYQSKKILTKNYDNRGDYGNSILLPLGLPFEETIEETVLELKYTLMDQLRGIPKTIVLCVGSGTILAGIYKGLEELKSEISLYGILTRTGNTQSKLEKIKSKSGSFLEKDGFFKSCVDIHLIDEGYQYTQKVDIEIPFPCNPYYDAKAWAWLMRNKDSLKKPILFWNIGQ